MIDGFSQKFINQGIDICDLISTCQQLNPEPYLICTFTETPTNQIPSPWQLGFR